MANSHTHHDDRPQPWLGWIGLGSMGISMATNLQSHLTRQNATPLTYFNRTISKGDPLAQLGASPASSIGDLVSRSDIVFLSLSDDAALTSTIDTITQSGERSLQGKLIVDTTTVHPDTTTKVADLVTRNGGQFIAAPVFGASPVAAQGQLLWVIAGSDNTVEKIEPYIVGVMGRGIIRLGETPSSATMLKTAGNFVTAGMMEVIAETHVFAEKTGLGNDAMESLLEQQYGPLALSMSKRLTSGAYMPPKGERPYSDIKLALKDVGHGVACAEKVDVRLGVAELALSNLKRAEVYGDQTERGLDSSSMYGVLRQDAGLSFETNLVKNRDEDAVASAPSVL